MQSKWLICGDGFLGKEFCQRVESIDIPSGIHATLKRAHQATSESLRQAAGWLEQNETKFFVNASGPSNVSDSSVRESYYESEPISLAKAHIQLFSRLQRPPTYIFLSSAAIYGETSKMGANEETSPKPISAYGIGKVKAEDYLLNLLERDIKIVILRLFSTYSSTLVSRLPFAIKQKFDLGTHAVFEGSGLESRDFVHMADVIASIKWIASQGSVEKTSIWNIASGTGITVSEVVRIAAIEYESLLTDVKYSFSFSNSLRKFDPSILLADVSKLVELGFTPRINPHLGLAEYFRPNK